MKKSKEAIINLENYIRINTIDILKMDKYKIIKNLGDGTYGSVAMA